MDVSVIGRAPGGVGALPRLETGPSPAPEAPEHRPASARAPTEPTGGTSSPRSERRSLAPELVAWFDRNGDGRIDNTSWMLGGDAFLVGDRANDGTANLGIDSPRKSSREAPRRVALPDLSSPTATRGEPGPAGHEHDATLRRAADAYERYGAPISTTGTAPATSINAPSDSPGSAAADSLAGIVDPGPVTAPAT